MIVSVEEAAVDDRGILRVAGWAAGLERVERIDIVAGGVPLGQARHGLPRPDVAAGQPEFLDVGLCGFMFEGPLDERARQAEQLFVIAHIQGRSEKAVTAHPIAKAGGAALATDGLRFYCDVSALYDDGAVELGGWAAHVDEVARIEVSLDGVAIGEAQIGRPRPDVGGSHPDIPSAGRSGYEFGAKLDELAAGEHEITLIVGTLRGGRYVRTLKASTQIARDAGRAAERQDIRVFVDSPRVVDGAFEAPVRRLLAIEGWAIARHGVAAVEAFLDGALVSVASRGVRRQDIGASYPDWPDSLMSGYAIVLPRKVFSKDDHILRIAARDRRGEVKEIEIRVSVEPLDPEAERGQLRSFVPEAEIALKQALIAAAAPPPLFAAFVLPGGSQDGLARTLASLAGQAYPQFRVGFLASSPGESEAAKAVAGEAGIGLRIFDAGEPQELASAAETLLHGATGSRFLLMLRAGDRLGADALLEFALDIATRPEEDFHYADDSRFDPVQGRAAELLKPEWSPDLLLATNYIGRAWCAALDLVRRARLPLAQGLVCGDYDVVLRLTETAREIGRAPLLLAESGAASDDAEREKAALRAAMARRGVAGGVRETAAPGVYRLRRRLRSKGLVSIIIPTIAKGGFVEKCVASLRSRTAYSRFEIVLVDNIADPDAPEKEWLKRNADCVVEYPGRFNWSKLNNLGAEAAFGDYLLFLNDDVEATDPRWLHALMEHAEQPEVGVVGPRLLYPDGRVQHAGLYLVESSGRHAFRFAERDELGAFGLAVAERDVAALTGACMLMRRAAFQEVGGFDEEHAVINNDVDMCLRMWRAGLRVVYTPHATLAHHEMASRSEVDDVFDQARFNHSWRNTFGLGDPFHHPRMSREEFGFAPDSEPTRVIVAGRPLMARDKVRRILVQKLDHVGDFITGLPAIQRLKQRFPQAEIHVLAASASARLARLEPAIDSVIEFDFFHSVSQQGRLELGDAAWEALEARLKPYRFDLAVDMRKHVDTRDVLKRSGARLTAGFDRRQAFPWLDIALEWDGDERYLPKRTQVAEDYLALAETVSLAFESERGFVAAPAADAAIATLRALPAFADLAPGLFDRPIVGVHPAAGALLRQWPPEHFALLIDLIVAAFDVNVALIGAPGEARIVEATLEQTRATDRVWSLAGRTKLDELPTLLSALRLFVGNNSGPHHLAAALGAPTVGVHSAVVSAREWGPLGPKAVAVQREMSCGPCYLDKPSACGRGIACLTGLRPADVFRVCEQMLGPSLRYGA
jgi:ADP-heptose:LPS heptosyltransferase/GT2 family glycosyltransferase